MESYEQPFRENDMPRKTDLSSFGQSYEQLLLRAHESLRVGGSGEYTVQFDSPNIAMSIRGRTYAYFKALRSSKDRPDLASLLDGISIRVAGSAMVFFRRGEELDELAIRKALGIDAGLSSPGLIAPKSAQTDALDKLKRIRERK